MIFTPNSPSFRARIDDLRRELPSLCPIWSFGYPIFHNLMKPVPESCCYVKSGEKQVITRVYHPFSQCPIGKRCIWIDPYACGDFQHVQLQRIGKSKAGQKPIPSFPRGRLKAGIPSGVFHSQTTTWTLRPDVLRLNLLFIPLRNQIGAALKAQTHLDATGSRHCCD